MATRKLRPHPFPGTGAKIREARLRLGLSAEALGNLVGSNKGHISGWELDKHWPREDKLAALETALGIELPRRQRKAGGRASTGTAICGNPECGKTFPTYFGELYCCRACAAVGKSEFMKGRNVKTGRTIDTQGYVRVLMPEPHPRKSGGYVREHILVMEKKLGRHLLLGERVHHKNAKRWDNRPDNLELWVTGTKDPPGQRVVDLIDNALSHPSLGFLTAPKRALVRLALLRGFGLDPDEEPSNPESPRLL